MIIERSIYVLNSNRDTCRGKLVETLMSIGYKASEADADVWMKRYFKPNGNPKYNFVLCYVDELLHICFKTKEEMDVLNVIDWLRGGFGPPD